MLEKSTTMVSDLWRKARAARSFLRSRPSVRCCGADAMLGEAGSRAGRLPWTGTRIRLHSALALD